MESSKHTTHKWFFIPETESKWLSGVVTLLVLLFGCEGLWQMADSFSGGVDYFRLLWGGVFLLTGAGLWALKNWARILAQVFCLMTMLVAIVGVINPFYAGDMLARGVEPITNTRLIVLGVVLWSGFWLTIIHVLGKNKKSFK